MFYFSRYGQEMILKMRVVKKKRNRVVKITRKMPVMALASISLSTGLQKH